MAGVLGISGIKIQKYVNTNASAGSLSIFSGVTKGIVFITFNQSMAGHQNVIGFVRDANNISLNAFNAGSEAAYQTLTISSGVVTLANAGYGIGQFTAYWIS